MKLSPPTLIISVLILGLALFIIPHQEASAQTELNVTDSGTPCFLNYTAGVDMWRNCGFDEDYIAATLIGFEWVTGGLFSMFIVIMLIMISYLKYHNALYPIAIGITMMPFSFYLFPELFLSYGIIFAFTAIGAMIWYIIIRQTKEY